MLQPIRKTLLVPLPDGRNFSCVNKTGFTLIELLVVVLIIGILAAIAVPQYKLAVDKARVRAYMPLVRSFVDAEERFYLANGRYAFIDERDALDLSFPAECQPDSENSRNILNCGNHISFEVYTNSSSDSTPITLAMLYCFSDSSPCRNNNNDVIIFKRFENQPEGGIFSDRPGQWGCGYRDYGSYQEKLCKAIMKF